MPRRPDLESICVIGAGPIVIGQACEFDYSGSQALKVLRAEGYRTIVVNSNPATIMTDPGYADRTYLEPLDVEGVTGVLERDGRTRSCRRRRQTALNLARRGAGRRPRRLASADRRRLDAICRAGDAGSSRDMGVSVCACPNPSSSTSHDHCRLPFVPAHPCYRPSPSAAPTAVARANYLARLL